MSGFFQDVFKGAASGFFGDRNDFKDFSHASKTFVTNAFGNAPKYKWLFHVYFDINKQYLGDPAVITKLLPDTTNYGLLVKNIQLPKYSVKLTEMNQYNRKRYIQTKIDYDPVSITFHDDNNNQLKNLWATYSNYYFYDFGNPQRLNTYRSQPGDAADSLNIKNTYAYDIADNQSWGYSGDIVSSIYNTPQGLTKAPFFKSIRIYGFNQHNFSGYELINPVIESFSHDTYNYYETTGIMENSMTLRYESVKYFQGALKGTKPEESVDGFGAVGVYDRVLSPITRPGSNASILGQNGLLDSAASIYEDISNGNILGAIQTAGRTARTFKNPQNILRAANNELLNGAKAAVASAIAGPFVFPSNGTGNNQTPSNNGQTSPKSVGTNTNPGGQ